MYKDKNNTVELDKQVREYFDKMSYEELMGTLKTTKYKPTLYSINYKDPNVMEMEDKNYVLAVFPLVVNAYIEWWGRFPTPKEYANYNIELTYRRLQRDGVHITLEVKKALYNRRVNSYISFMVEIQTRKLLDRLLPSNYCIYSSEEMDLLHGVDIVIQKKDTDRFAYIHVTSNTIYARERAIQKSKKLGRDFTGHTWLYYDKKNIRQSLDNSLPPLDTETTTEVNGFFFFKESFILQRLDYIFYKLNK